MPLADVEWRELDALLQDPQLSGADALTKLRAFKAKHGTDHPNASALERRMSMARSKARSEAWRAQRAAEKAAEPALAERFLKGSVPDLGAEVLYRALKWSDRAEAGPNYKPATLTLIDGVAKTYEQPHRLGLGAMRSHLESLSDRRAPKDAVAKPRVVNGVEIQGNAINAALKTRLKGNLFASDAPAKLNLKVLKKLLDAAWIAPDDALLGVTARDVYRVVQPGVTALAMIYKVMRDDLGKPKVLKAYRKALKDHPDKGKAYNRDMMAFYRAFPKTHGIAEKAGVGDYYGAYVMSGFWMRRMHDGTDTLLASFMRRGLKTYDRKLHDAVFASK